MAKPIDQITWNDDPWKVVLRWYGDALIEWVKPPTSAHQLAKNVRLLNILRDGNSPGPTTIRNGLAKNSASTPTTVALLGHAVKLGKTPEQAVDDLIKEPDLKPAFTVTLIEAKHQDEIRHRKNTKPLFQGIGSLVNEETLRKGLEAITKLDKTEHPEVVPKRSATWQPNAASCRNPYYDNMFGPAHHVFPEIFEACKRHPIEKTISYLGTTYYLEENIEIQDLAERLGNEIDSSPALRQTGPFVREVEYEKTKRKLSKIRQRRKMEGAIFEIIRELSEAGASVFIAVDFCEASVEIEPTPMHTGEEDCDGFLPNFRNEKQISIFIKLFDKHRDIEDDDLWLKRSDWKVLFDDGIGWSLPDHNEYEPQRLEDLGNMQAAEDLRDLKITEAFSQIFSSTGKVKRLMTNEDGETKLM